MGGRIIEGDNLIAMKRLAEREPGSVALAYIDPPFNTKSRFDATRKAGDPGVEFRLPAYEDTWSGRAGFLTMMWHRLSLIHELLADDGSLYVHVDPTESHAIKLILDEIFGPECYQREIVWRIGWLSGFKTRARNWIRNHDVLLFYTKDPKRFCFNKQYLDYPEGYVRRDGKPPTGKGIPLSDVWNVDVGDVGRTGPESLDSIQIKSFSREKTGWATQKNESLLRRIIEVSSNVGDTVLDAFAGSATTAAVCGALDRRFIAIERLPLATSIARLRLRERGTGFEHWRVGTDAPRDGLSLQLQYERNRLFLRVDGLLGGLEAELPSAVTELLEAEPRAAIEGWSVQWSATGSVHAPDETAQRSLHRRTLVPGAAFDYPDGDHRLEVRVDDVLGRRHRAAASIRVAHGRIIEVTPLGRTRVDGHVRRS